MHDMIEKFYREHRDSYVYRISRKAGGLENAEDIVQEAFCRLLKYQTFFEDKGEEALHPYFSRVLNRALQDFRTEDTRQGMALAEYGMDEEASNELMGYQKRILEEIKEDITSRKQEHKNILYMFFYLGYPPRDIVKALDVNYHMAKNVINRFKHEMREKYGNPEAAEIG